MHGQAIKCYQENLLLFNIHFKECAKETATLKLFCEAQIRICTKNLIKHKKFNESFPDYLSFRMQA